MNVLPNTTMLLLSFYLFVVGAVFASFASLIGDRVPNGVSIVRPRSFCASCGHTLSALELIPIISWLFLRGRCSACKVAIPIRYAVFEMALGVVLVISIWTSQPSALLEHFVLWFVLIIAMSTDMNSLVVPNWLTFPSAAVMVCVALLSSGNIMHPIIGAGVGFGLIWIVHVASGGKMGLGDAKLYISIGAILGIGLCIESFVLACAYGAIIGGFMRITGRLKPREPIAFVPFIALGVFSSEFWLPNLWKIYVDHLFALHV